MSLFLKRPPILTMSHCTSSSRILSAFYSILFGCVVVMLFGCCLVVCCLVSVRLLFLLGGGVCLRVGGKGGVRRRQGSCARRCRHTPPTPSSLSHAARRGTQQPQKPHDTHTTPTTRHTTITPDTKRHKRTHLRRGHAAREQAQQVARLDDRGGVPRLARRAHGHAALDEVELAADSGGEQRARDGRPRLAQVLFCCLVLVCWFVCVRVCFWLCQ